MYDININILQNGGSVTHLSFYWSEDKYVAFNLF